MQAMSSLPGVVDSNLPWAVLVILLGLVALVGPKAGASDVKFKEGVDYKRPMLTFELHAAQAPDIFDSWNEAKARLRAALLWDYLFIFIYPAAIATSCFLAGRFLDSRGIIPFKVTLVVMCLQLLAAAFDAAENFALLKVIGGSMAGWPQVARWCAILKFSLVALGTAYALFGVVCWLYGGVKALAQR